MSYRGLRADYVVVDELTNHTVDALSYLSIAKGDTVTFSAPPLILQPMDIYCKACGAVAGERCTKPHRRHGKTRRGYHFRRKDDARLATEAIRALNPA